MKRILVATDFSTRSDRAMRRATLIAKQRGAEIVVVHVVDDDLPAKLLEVERRAAEDLLFDLAQTVRTTDSVPCRSRVMVGEPFDAIAAAVEQDAAEAVVLGPHRRRSIRDMFTGTTAERAISRAVVPMLMANGVPSKPYENVLIATDLSASSAAAARFAQRLGFLDMPETGIVHVIDAPAEGLVSFAAPSSRKDQMEEEKARASAALADFVGRDLPWIGRHHVRITLSSTAETILQAARDAGADLVVLGKEGRSTVDRIALGSVVSEVLKRADIDVLVVPRRLSEVNVRSSQR